MGTENGQDVSKCYSRAGIVCRRLGGGGIAREHPCTGTISALSPLPSLVNFTPLPPELSLERDPNARCASLAQFQAHDVLPATLPVGIKSPQANHRPNVIAQPIARPSNHPSSLSWRRLDSGDPPNYFQCSYPSFLPEAGDLDR